MPLKMIVNVQIAFEFSENVLCVSYKLHLNFVWFVRFED